MKILKNLKSLLTLVFVFGFLFAVVTTSCGPKKSESDDTEQVEEHPSEDEHPSDGDEHPSDGNEHPSQD